MSSGGVKKQMRESDGGKRVKREWKGEERVRGGICRERKYHNSEFQNSFLPPSNLSKNRWKHSRNKERESGESAEGKEEERRRRRE